MKIDYWQSLEPDCCYHVYNRAVDSEKLFKDDFDYINFLKKYQKYLHPYFDTYAYCLMPNHFHFIIKVKSKEEIESASKSEKTNMVVKYQKQECTTNQLIGDQLRRMLSSISIKTNNKYKRRGPLFTPGVKRHFIDNDDKLRYLIGYVHHNPIHHGYESEFTNWKYSSFTALSANKETLLVRDEVIQLFGSQKSFASFHEAFQLEKMQEDKDDMEP